MTDGIKQTNTERKNNMPIIKQSESTYEPVPAGTHPARCYGMVSLGTQPTNNPQFKPQFKVVLMFEFPNEILERNGEKKPMMISHFLSAYLGSTKKPSKTNLFLTSWRGRPFKPEELAGFDLSAVVGAPCLLNIVHEERGGKMREVIASISPLPKGMTINGQINPKIVYEIEQKQDATFQALPEWCQKMIAQCEEWNAPLPPHEPEAEAEDDDKDSVPF
jgi:hypothetical protein